MSFFSLDAVRRVRAVAAQAYPLEVTSRPLGVISVVWVIRIVIKVVRVIREVLFGLFGLLARLLGL
jgi:hypothetical protein